MKLKGQKVAPPSPVKCVFYRDGGNIEFQCGAVMNTDDFDKLCPPPKAPLTTNIKTQEQRENLKDKSYLAALSTRNRLYHAYFILASLSVTPGLEWETVQMDKPDTWLNYDSELNEVLTSQERARLIDAINEANSPSSNRRSEALERFTSSQEEEAQTENSSQKEEPTNTPSSEPANA